MHYILIVLIFNNSWSNAGNYSSTAHAAPAVSMQEFSNQQACLFAGNEILHRAGNAAAHIHATCVPKG